MAFSNKQYIWIRHGLVAIVCGYGFELLCFQCFRSDWPVLSHVASAFQLPTAIFAMNVPAPSVEPHAKELFMKIMFTSQGFLFSTIIFFLLRNREATTVEKRSALL